MGAGAVAVGVDVGGSLTKVVIERDGARRDRILPTQSGAALGFVLEQDAQTIGCTGGGGPAFAAALGAARHHTANEFEAWGRGASLLLAEKGCAMEERFLLFSVGTGTAAMLVEAGRGQRVGGCSLGGGTLLGLGQLLLGTSVYDEITALASRGDRLQVDLEIRSIYPDFPAGFTAAHFAHPQVLAGKPRGREDLAHAVAVLVGENVALLGAALAQAHGVRQLVFGGASLRNNPAMWEIIERMVALRGLEAIPLDRGELAGAIGALAIARDRAS